MEQYDLLRMALALTATRQILSGLTSRRPAPPAGSSFVIRQDNPARTSPMRATARLMFSRELANTMRR
jgi:hypothetical protein